MSSKCVNLREILKNFQLETFQKLVKMELILVGDKRQGLGLQELSTLTTTFS